MINSNTRAMFPQSRRRNNTNGAGSGRWLVRTTLILFGLAAMFIGWEAVGQGYWWVRYYNPWEGIATGPTLSFVFIGAIFVVFGLVPWRRAQKSHKSKNDIYRMP